MSALPLLAACEADSPFEPATGNNDADAAVGAILPVNANFALQFDGLDDRVNLTPGSITSPVSITVEAWARLDATGKLHFLVSGAQNDFHDGFNLLVTPGGQVFFAAALSASVNAGVTGTTAMAIGTWYHVAGTYDADKDTLKVFVNGVEEAAAPYAGGIMYSAGRDLRFGTQIKTFAQSGRFLKGALDEVRIWNHARTADELAADMVRDIAGDAAGLLGYWRIDEGSGDVTADATANNNTGVLERGLAGLIWIEGHPKPLVADAGADQTVECTGPDGAAVTLDGSGSSDPGGATLTYTWTDANGNVLANGAGPTINLAMGSHTITLTVSNGSMEASNDVVITVVDTTPPEVSAALEPVGDVSTTQGQFTVVFSCADACDANAASSAELNGVAVSNGQIVQLKLVDSGQTVATVNGVLHIDAPSFSLTASCNDAAGNAGSASASPVFAAAPQSYTFAWFLIEEAEVEVDREGYRFEIEGELAVNPASDGIDLLDEEVTLTFAGYSETIPAGSFFRKEDDEGYRYKGDSPGLKRVEIRDDGEFKVKGRGIDLSGIDSSSPVVFSLEIGNDHGETEIWFDGEGSYEAEGLESLSPGAGDDSGSDDDDS